MEIKYLCYVSDKQVFSGIKSREYQDWLKSKTDEYTKEHFEGNPNFIEWLKVTTIPHYEGNPTTDIELLSLPKVFEVSTQEKYYELKDKARWVSMQLSGNIEHLILCVL